MLTSRLPDGTELPDASASAHVGFAHTDRPLTPPEQRPDKVRFVHFSKFLAVVTSGGGSVHRPSIVLSLEHSDMIAA